MSAILDKLLKGRDVEWQSIANLQMLNRGKRLVRSQLEETGLYPVYQNSLTPLGYFSEKNTLPNTAFIISAGAAGEIGYSETEFWAADDCYFFKVPRDILKDKFLYYFLLTQKTKIISQVRKASVPRLGRNSVENILIPIPPLDVQAEIVRILDAFTAVTAELTQELAREKILREKQYQYYRDKLLSFSDVSIETDSNRQQQTALCERLTNNVKQNHQIIWKNLGEVVKIKNGKDWKNLGQGDIPVYGSGGIMNYVDKASYDKVSVLIPRKGTITNIFYTEKPFWNVDTIFYTEIDESQIFPKFLFHFMKNFDLTTLSTDSTRPSLTQTTLNKISIPLPSLNEQKRISNILDKFETLTHSITQGLPKEITLRKQQYEYYREQLLDFPKD